MLIILQYTEGDRRDAPNDVIVITDGQSTIHSTTVTESKLLKDTGATVVVIGILRADTQELIDIASPGKAMQILDLHNTSAATDKVLQLIC